jgi:hypothetical protein
LCRLPEQRAILHPLRGRGRAPPFFASAGRPPVVRAKRPELDAAPDSYVPGPLLRRGLRPPRPGFKSRARRWIGHSVVAKSSAQRAEIATSIAGWPGAVAAKLYCARSLRHDYCRGSVTRRNDYRGGSCGWGIVAGTSSERCAQD